jgi:hypothetical protein
MAPKTPKTKNPGLLVGLERKPKLDRLGVPAGINHPSWRFVLVDVEHHGTWGWRYLTETKLREIVVFLKQMERLSWQEVWLQQAGGHGRRGPKHKYIPIEHCDLDAQQRLGELELEEYNESWFRFRLAGTERLWGVLQEGVFYPVWWDHDHKVCPGNDRS